MTEPARSLDLLPCPFCGKPAVLCPEEDETYVVACDWCRAQSGIGHNAEHAITLWNRRAEPTEAPAAAQGTT